MSNKEKSKNEKHSTWGVLLLCKAVYTSGFVR
jgi:hypothetical protein